MVKKRSSFAQHGPYLAIVAVVAVVAIVFLILNFAGISSTGEAIRFTRTASTTASAPASSQEECNSLERRCDLAKKSDTQKLVFVGNLNAVASKLYGDDDYITVKNGNEICSDLGYSGCFSAHMHYSRQTYNPLEGFTPCTGQTPVYTYDSSPVECDVIGQWTECIWDKYITGKYHINIDGLTAVTCIE